MTTTKRRTGTVSFARFKLGLTQQELADTLGVSRSLIAMVETGKRKWPPAAHTIYLALCNKAAAINPGEAIEIKKGRKPATAQTIQQTPSVVTNYRRYRWKRRRSMTGRSKNRARLAKAMRYPPPPPVSVDQLSPADKQKFMDMLERKKKGLGCRHAVLEFKKQMIREREQHLSFQLKYVTTMLELSNKLLHTLPPGKVRDRQELNAAVFTVKQIRLKQQLKKYDVVALLQTEFQMNMLKTEIGELEKYLAEINNGQALQPMQQMTNTAHYCSAA